MSPVLSPVQLLQLSALTMCASAWLATLVARIAVRAIEEHNAQRARELAAITSGHVLARAIAYTSARRVH